MAATLVDFREWVEDELGDAYQLVRDAQIDSWVNRGFARLGLSVRKSAALSWDAAAASVALPADCVDVETVVPGSGYVVPDYRRTGAPLGGSLTFTLPEYVEAGSATLYYRASFPRVTGDAPSEASPAVDEAVLSFVLSCFFKRIASTRSDFRRYVSVTGQSGIDVVDLLEIADRHRQDFLDASQSLPLPDPAPFFGV